jgi:RES domain-containing protein
VDRATLYSAFEGLGGAPFSGTAYRQVAPRYDCASGEGAARAGGRWNVRDGLATLYLALSPETAAAELRLAAERSAQPLDAFLPRKLCVLRIAVSRVVDLRPKEAMAVLGLHEEDTFAPDWGPCQAVGDAAYRYGLDGIVVPSASRVGSVLVLFLVNLSASSTLATDRLETWAAPADLPA